MEDKDPRSYLGMKKKQAKDNGGEEYFLKQVIFKMKSDKQDEDFFRLEADLKFLKELRQRLEKAKTDVTEFQMIEKMLSDWEDQTQKDFDKVNQSYP